MSFQEVVQLFSDYQHIIFIAIGFTLGFLAADIRAIYNMRKNKVIKK